MSHVQHRSLDLSWTLGTKAHDISSSRQSYPLIGLADCSGLANADVDPPVD